MKKRTLLFVTICATALIYISCSNDKNTADQTNVTAVGASVAIDATTEMDINTALLVTASNTTAKSATAVVGICATITVETPTAGASYPKVFTVDYGTAGCTDNLITKKGKLKITLSGPVITTGSKMTIERMDYSINGIKLEGTIEYTNTTSDQTIPQWTRKITNGKFTDLLGDVYLSAGNHTVRQTAGVSTLTLDDNVYEMIDGTHTITDSKGATLTFTVQESLIKNYSCTYISKGKLKVAGSVLNGVIDYGNNDCDNKYTYTHENGTVFNLTM